MRRDTAEGLAALCDFFETAAGGCVCAIFPIDPNGPSFRDIIAPSLAVSFVAAVEGQTLCVDASPCGAAVLLREQIVVRDIATDQRWKSSGCSQHLLAYGLRSVWMTPITSQDGRVLGTFGVYRNAPALPTSHEGKLIAQVTNMASIALDRERREAELRRSQTFLAQAQRLTQTGSFWWKASTGEVVWSEENYRIMEYPVTMTPTVEMAMNRCHPDDMAMVQAKLEAVVRDGGSADFEHRLLMPDGAVKHVRLLFQNVAFATDDPEFVGAATDITALKQTEETLSTLRSELAHVARFTSLGALTASIAHEVNQPLSGIVMNASTCMSMLASDTPNLDGARETARRMIRDGNRASEVITRLRALFLKKPPAREPVDLNEAITEVIALSRSDLQRSRATIRLELDDALPRVPGDRVQLQQVILNLLRNAAEAMSDVHERSREVVIRTLSDDNEAVRISVRDCGVGFAAKSTERLFDAFYTTKPDGMGIGLSVSRSIVESHGGRLLATPNDDAGMTFSLSLPTSFGETALSG